MESSQSQHPTFKQSLPADDSPFELYTIPINSSWFSWDNIHEIEKTSLKEFFDGSSITRSPRIYKEYRDFIISKYREDPSRRLTFSEVRKSLVGDVNFLRKVFSLLDKWGLINFGSPLVIRDDDLEIKEERWKIKVEEGPPHGVRVVAIPNSLKPVSLPLTASSNGSFSENDFKFPPLASHSDVYRDLIQPKELVCGNCQKPCDSGHYEYIKEGNSIICVRCFKNGNYGTSKSADDFKFVDCIPNSGTHGAVWTEAETLLLLESVLKHGDDWDLVAQNFQTKSKLDCISKLIQLPFGELMLGSAYDKCRYWDTTSNINSFKQGQVSLTVSQETTATEHCHDEPDNQNRQNGEADTQGPPTKRVCTAPISDSNNSLMEQTEQKNKQVSLSSIVSQETMEIENQRCESNNERRQDGDAENQCPSPMKVYPAPTLGVSSSLMKQVARFSTIVGPQITASAAEAAVTALCYENLCPREIFCEDEGDELGFSTQTKETERTPQGNDSEMDERLTQSEKSAIPLTLRMRAATATALGAAAAHAKLLAIQEDREVEHLVATIIDKQMKKLHCKMKLLNDLELIMEKEFTQMEDLEESLVSEQMDVIQRIFDAGISRFRDHTSMKPQTGTIF